MEITRITKQQLSDLYINKHLSLGKISKIYGVHPQTVLNRMRKMDIPTRTISEANLLRYDNYIHKDLVPRELDILYGELLGDGNIYGKKGVYQHGCKFRLYIEWLTSILPNLKWSNINISIRGKRRYYYIKSHYHPSMVDTYKLFYPQGNKIIPNIKLNATILLHWYLGDGTYSPGNKRIRLSACNFEKTQIEEIILPQLKSLGLKASLHGKTKTYRIYIWKRSHDSFFKIIGSRSPIICYDYKFPNI